jgi:ABC-type branched-subunit amino acid transport system substrate-binding protein
MTGLSGSARTIKGLLALGMVGLLAGGITTARAEDGVTAGEIKVATVTALKGPTEGLGLGMKAGMEAAFSGAKVKGRSVTLISANDFYEPDKAAIEARRLAKEGVFLMIGNVGTPTAVATLPILKENNIPAVGFFTGAGLLRPGAGGPIVNYRASYVQETVTVIKEAMAAGVPIGQVCAFVQNDAYGMAGLVGVKTAYEQNRGDAAVIQTLDAIVKMQGDNPARNNQGPVGVYTRNTIDVKPGYASLKAWEKKSGKRCRVVVTVGAYAPIAHFVRESRKQKDRYPVSAVSFTGADNFQVDLAKYNVTEGVVMTQVVPLLDSKLPIVTEARAKLGRNFGFVSLEGYVVGKMFLRILGDIPGDLTRAAFMQQVAKSKFDLGGIPIDFTRGTNQGSDLIVTSQVTKQGFRAMNADAWKKIVR